MYVNQIDDLFDGILNKFNNPIFSLKASCACFLISSIKKPTFR